MSKAGVAEPQKATGIAVIESSKFMALNMSEDMKAAQEAAAMAGETFTADDLIRVPTPSGGATRWTIPNVAGDETVQSIDGILVCYQPCGVLWPGVEPTPGAIPVLRTFNPTAVDAIAEQVGPIPDSMREGLMKHCVNEGPPATFRWANIPQNQWGSGKGGSGKMCKEQRMLFILREGDMFPLLVRIQPGSLKSVSNFFKQLVPSAKVPYYRCIVGLGLEKAINKAGQPYSKVVPKLLGTVDKTAGEQVFKNYTSVLQKLVRDIEVDSGVDAGDE